MTINGLKELASLAVEHGISLGAMLVLVTFKEQGFFFSIILEEQFKELLENELMDKDSQLTDEAYAILSKLSTPEVRMFNEFIQLIPTSDRFANYPRTTALRSKYNKAILKELYQRVVKSGVSEEIILQKFSAKVEELKRTSYLCNNLTKMSPYKILEDMLSNKDNGVINRSSENIL